ncbi:hypothetical protein HK405_009926, partial [Cladochytrium tenue]
MATSGAKVSWFARAFGNHAAATPAATTAAGARTNHANATAAPATADDSTSPLLPPRSDSFAQVYSIGKVLGKGTFATVSECTRRSDGQHFAVKVIDKRNIKTPAQRATLLSEIRVLAELHHPNIIGLVDAFDSDRHLYLVTQLATGGELFDRIVEKGSYTERDAAVIVKQLVDAIDYLHSLDKTPEAPILVSDFGLSKHATSDDFLRTACGTPGYVAPEILKRTGHGKPVDLWALGVITYVLLCGYTPFWGDSQQEMFDSILKGDYCFDEEYWSSVSDTAKDFVNQLLQVDASRRPTAAKLLEHPWLQTESTTDILPTFKKNFNARRTFKK